MPLSSPYRTFDTRAAACGGVALGPGQAEDWSFADFASSVAIGPDSVGNQLAVIGNLTSASAHAPVPVRCRAARSSPPTRPAPNDRCRRTSTPSKGPAAVPNMAVLKYGANNTVRVYNLAGYAHYLFDASAVVFANES